LSGFNYVHFTAQNVHALSGPNPKAGAWNLRNAIGAHFRDVQVSTGEAPTTSLTQPTDLYSTAFWFPAVNNHAQSSCEGCSVIGFPRAFVVSEHDHFIGDNYASFSKVCVEFQQGGHLVAGKVGCEFTATALKVTGSPSVVDLTLTGESDRTSGAWTQGSYDIDDASSLLMGDIRYEMTLGGVGTTVSARRNGAGNIRLINLRSSTIESGPLFQETAPYWALSGTPIRIRDTHANGSVNSIQGVPNGAGLFDMIVTANGHVEAGGATRNYTGTSWRSIWSNALDAYLIQRAAAGGLSPSYATLVSVDNTGKGTFAGGAQLGSSGTSTTRLLHGTCTLTAGACTVSTALVTANSRVMLTGQDNNVTGALRVSARSAGVSFTITSSVGADTGVVAWEIIEP
jgi:hypothetical protein